jgi:hypothetical protein
MLMLKKHIYSRGMWQRLYIKEKLHHCRRRQHSLHRRRHRRLHHHRRRRRLHHHLYRRLH